MELVEVEGQPCLAEEGNDGQEGDGEDGRGGREVPRNGRKVKDTERTAKKGDGGDVIAKVGGKGRRV